MCILAYHMVDSQFFWGVTRVTPHLFSKQINLLLDVGIKFLNISEYLLLDPQQRKQNIALTFDDGYESVYTQAFPILKAKGLTAGVFINPGFVGQYNTWDANFGKRTRHMDWNQILALKEEGWEIGSHGLSHKDVTKLHPDHASRELQLSHDLIKKHVGECSRVFSFPFGSLNLQVLSICRYIGYTAALVMGANNLEKNIYSRTGIYLFDTAPFFKYKVFAKDRFFINLLQKGFDCCSNLTVMAQSKKWNADKI